MLQSILGALCQTRCSLLTSLLSWGPKIWMPSSGSSLPCIPWPLPAHTAQDAAGCPCLLQFRCYYSPFLFCPLQQFLPQPTISFHFLILSHIPELRGEGAFWQRLRQECGTESLSPICARCYEMTSLALRRRRGVTPMTGVLEWKDTGSLGRTG